MPLAEAEITAATWTSALYTCLNPCMHTEAKRCFFSETFEHKRYSLNQLNAKGGSSM
jgi:hypothetical protein